MSTDEDLRTAGMNDPIPAARAVLLYARVLYVARTTGHQLSDDQLAQAAADALADARAIVAERG